MVEAVESISLLSQRVLEPKRIAVAGIGMVGGALVKTLKSPILYDPPKGIGSKEELNEAEIVFVCVPTPYENGFSLKAVIAVLDILEGSKVVVIKSTVLPGTTDHLQHEYPQHKFLFNPEFLTEATADQDMRYPDRQIVGYTDKSYTIAGDIMAMLPLAPFERIMPAKEAELVKYANNTWFATKVVWANQLYDLCEKTGIDYESVKEAMVQDKRIGRSHLEIWHKGYRGYGGKCLPKDLSSLVDYAGKNGVDMALLKKVRELNDHYGKSL